jgi:hypothetical protein
MSTFDDNDHFHNDGQNYDGEKDIDATAQHLYVKNCNFTASVREGKYSRSDLETLDNYLFEKAGIRASRREDNAIYTDDLCAKLKAFFDMHPEELSVDFLARLPLVASRLVLKFATEELTVKASQEELGKMREVSKTWKSEVDDFADRSGLSPVNTYTADKMEELVDEFWHSIVGSLYDSTVAGFTVLERDERSVGGFRAVLRVRRRLVVNKVQDGIPVALPSTLYCEVALAGSHVHIIADSGIQPESRIQWAPLTEVDTFTWKPIGLQMDKVRSAVPSFGAALRGSLSGIMDLASYRLVDANEARGYLTNDNTHPLTDQSKGSVGIPVDGKWLFGHRFFLLKDKTKLAVEPSFNEDMHWDVFDDGDEFNVVREAYLMRPVELLKILKTKIGDTGNNNNNTGEYAFPLLRTRAVLHPWFGSLEVVQANEQFPGNHIKELLEKFDDDPDYAGSVVKMDGPQSIADYQGWPTDHRTIVDHRLWQINPYKDVNILSLPFSSNNKGNKFGNIAWYWWMVSRHITLSNVLHDSVAIDPMNHFYALNEQGAWSLQERPNSQRLKGFKSALQSTYTDINTSEKFQVTPIRQMSIAKPTEIPAPLTPIISEHHNENLYYSDEEQEDEYVYLDEEDYPDE